MRLAALKRHTHEWMHRFGFDVVPYSGRYFPNKLRVETMHRFEVQTVIDVGANTGQFVSEIRAAGWNGDVVSIEPLPSVFAVLADRASRDPRWTAIQRAAGSVRARRQINVAANTWSSSLLPMTKTHLEAAPDSRYTETVDVDVEPLDQILEPLGLFDGRPLYLKIDTQGYELEVLEGAPGAIAAAAALEVELSVAELYAGQPLIGEVMREVLDHGFVPTGIAPSFTAAGRVFQVNGLFIR